MHKVFGIFIISFFFITFDVLAQSSIKQNPRRNCSFVGRPIIDPAGGIVIGKVIKLKYPRLNETTKKFAQNATIIVKIEVDENGNVIFAKADNGVPILQNLSEQAAIKTKFSPTLVSGEPIKIKGQIVYKFKQGKSSISYSFEPINYEPNPIDYNKIQLVRMFDSKIVSLIKDFQEGKSIDSYDFVKDSQVNLQLCMQEKSPEILQKIEQTGFEILEETQGNGLVGQISVENLEELADIDEIRFIVPEPYKELVCTSNSNFLP